MPRSHTMITPGVVASEIVPTRANPPGTGYGWKDVSTAESPSTSGTRVFRPDTRNARGKRSAAPRVAFETWVSSFGPAATAGPLTVRA